MQALHMTDSTAYMYDLKNSDVSISGIGSKKLDALLEGTLHLMFEQTIVEIRRVMYVPELGYFFFSPVAEFDGVTCDLIGGPDRIMTAFGGGVIFRQDDGNTLSTTARRVAPTTAATALSAIAHTKKRESMDINDFHRIHAHASVNFLRATAKRLDVKLAGELKP